MYAATLTAHQSIDNFERCAPIQLAIEGIGNNFGTGLAVADLVSR